MNSQERDALNAFLQQMTQAQVAQKDSEAEALITQAFAAQPHAGYLLVQRAMQLDYVLQQSQGRVAELEAELERTKAGAQTSFLGDAYSWGRSASAVGASGAGALAPQAGTQVSAQPQRPVMQAAPMQAAPMQAGPAPVAAAPVAAATPWGSSVMGTVATTAAGVVAGSFLFQGIQNMMGHNSGGGFGGGSGFGNHSGMTPPAPVTVNETTVNNYYTNDPAADQNAYGSGSTLADASDNYDLDSDGFSSDDSDVA